LTRKLEQGLQQIQGEALEAGVEEMLRAAFPLDEIVEVPKGANGADLLQRVRSSSGQQEEKKSLKQEQHAARLAAKIERDRLWREKKG
jgi:hypothetical protein